MLSCLWDGACERNLAERVTHEVTAAGFLSRYLIVLYRRHVTVNVLSASINKNVSHFFI